MKSRRSLIRLCLAAVVLAAPLPVWAQTPDAHARTPIAATAPTIVPTLIPYSGTALASDGKPLKGEVLATFLIFAGENGGEPLWAESQALSPDAGGHYQAQLGASSSMGLPFNLFASGEGRWLEIQIAGEAPQPRVLLMSVPYAMKAADAATLGGLPASAFALAGSANATPPQPVGEVTGQTGVTTPGGTSGYLPVFSATATIDDSLLFESGTKIGINTNSPTVTLDVNGAIDARGTVTLESTGTASTAAGKNSQPLAFMASAYNSSTKAATAPLFQLQAEPAANDTTTPVATLNLLYADGNAPAETGLSISSKGLLKFAAGQTFPGTGQGTITGITTASPLTGTGTSGSVALGLNLPVLETTLNSKYAQTGAANTFSGANAFTAPVTFAASQTFPGTGKGTITGVTAGSGLTGGGTSGAVTLSIDTTKVPTLAANNTFTGIEKFNGFATFNGGFTTNQQSSIFAASTGLEVYTSQNGSIYANLDVPTGQNEYGWAIEGDASNAYSGVYGYGDNKSQAGVIGSGNIGVYALSDLFGSSGKTTGASTLTAAMYAQAGLMSSQGKYFSQFPAAAFADGGATSGTNQSQIALVGSTDDNNAAYLLNNSGQSTLYVVNSGAGDTLIAGNADAICDIDNAGDLSCSGTISGSNVTADKRALTTYGIQSAENWYEDYGSGQLQSGVAQINLDADFGQTVNTAVAYHVFLTPKGDCRGLYVTHETADGFEVHELGGGATNIAFDYKIVAKRKGYEQVRLQDITDRVRKRTEERLKRLSVQAHPASLPAIPPVPEHVQLKKPS